MPCRDNDDDCRTIYRDGHDPHYQQRYTDTKYRLDKVTELLCMAGRARRNKTNIPPAVLKWWDEHCKRDAAKGEPW